MFASKTGYHYIRPVFPMEMVSSLNMAACIKQNANYTNKNSLTEMPQQELLSDENLGMNAVCNHYSWSTKPAPSREHKTAIHSGCMNISSPEWNRGYSNINKCFLQYYYTLTKMETILLDTEQI
jgi:hypothetical protein